MFYSSMDERQHYSRRLQYKYSHFCSGQQCVPLFEVMVLHADCLWRVRNNNYYLLWQWQIRLSVDHQMFGSFRVFHGPAASCPKFVPRWKFF